MNLEKRLEIFKALLGEKGTADIAAAVREYRRAYGDNWLAEFKERMPYFSEMVDLSANYEFPEAWEKLVEIIDEWIDCEEGLGKRILTRTAVNLFLPGAKPDIERLHGALRAEIDRPRFQV